MEIEMSDREFDLFVARLRGDVSDEDDDDSDEE